MHPQRSRPRTFAERPENAAATKFAPAAPGMEFIDDDAEEDVIESFTESEDAHRLFLAFSAAASLTSEDDEIESFGESDEVLAEATPPNRDESNVLENVSLADAIKKGKGSDCERAASAVTRVMIALKKRRHETRLQNDVKSGAATPLCDALF